MHMLWLIVAGLLLVVTMYALFIMSPIIALLFTGFYAGNLYFEED